MTKRRISLRASLLGFVAAMPASACAGQPTATLAAAQETGGGSAPLSVPGAEQPLPGDIIVTAQKRSERINDVPITITAISGQALQQRGVTDTADLARIVAGFNYSRSANGTPVYLLRGVGFYDTSLAAGPTVSIYVDEVPLPFSRMARGAVFDLERVEVLKGPQGTLFGQNSTGGAINYIAAKPTSTLHAGVDVGYGSYDKWETQGFVSGPLSDTLNARIAVRHEGGGAWQQSNTRPGDKLGDADLTIGRLLLDWTPTSRLSFNLNVNGWIDKSDTQAAQLLAFTRTVGIPKVTAEPLSPQRARAADWDAEPFRSNDRYGQASLRTNLELTDAVKLTAITDYSHLKVAFRADPDGTAAQDFTFVGNGKLRTFVQEVRLDGQSMDDRLRWVVGGNYEHDTVFDSSVNLNRDFFLRAFFTSADARTTQRINTYAGFGNFDYKIAPDVSIQGGVRYTDQHRHFTGCLYDTGTGDIAAFTSRTANLVPPIAPGGCTTLGPNRRPQVTVSDLDESNWSWRGAIDWKVDPNKLLYASVSRGYKSGTFPTLGATIYTGFQRAVQEALLSYEAGFKLGLLDRTVQLNGSAFYYDYNNKQVRGKVQDPLLGAANALVNIPKSRVIGAELQLDWAPIKQLRFGGAAAYTDTKIKHFSNFNALGSPQSFDGEPFPYTPKWQLTGDAEFHQPIGNAEAFIGGNARYASATNAGLGQLSLFRIKSFATLDLRAGATWHNGVGVTVYVKNLTNTYYWTNTLLQVSTVTRYAALPRTFGASLSFRY